MSEIRRAGRARIEHDGDVRRALDGVVSPPAALPLQVRIDSVGERPVEVEIALSDGRVVVLAPVDSAIVLFGVPDAEARVRLIDPERD